MSSSDQTYTDSDSEREYKVQNKKKNNLPLSNNKDDFPALQGLSYEPEFQRVGSKKSGKKIYVFMISYDKSKGSQEKSTINLLANSLKDYVQYTFPEIKAMTDNSKLVREDFTETSAYVQWKFVWNVKEKFFEELLNLEEILMRTAEIYFRQEPNLEIKAQNTKGNAIIVSPIKPDSKLFNNQSNNVISNVNSNSNNSNSNNNNNINNNSNQQSQQQNIIKLNNSNSNGNNKPNSNSSSNISSNSNNNNNNNNGLKAEKKEVKKIKKQQPIFNTAEEEAQYQLKKQYKQSLQKNKLLIQQNKQLKQDLTKQETHLSDKITQLKQFVDVLQIMLQTSNI